MRRIGIWIDSRETLIANLGDSWITYNRIFSGVEKRPRYQGETSRRTKRQLGFDFETAQQAKFNQEMKRYIRAVVDYLGTTPATLCISGPGKVRIALEKELRNNKNLQVVKNEPLDNLTINQKLEWFRKFFESRKPEI